MMVSVTKWVDGARMRLEKWGWRLLLTVSATFALTFFFVYDRSHLESAISVVDKQLMPFGAGIIPLLSTTARTGSLTVPPPLFPGCNIFDGKWVFDDIYPLYNMCRLAEHEFQCQDNGRPDWSYQNWRWQPHECSIPRFDGQDMLARLQGLRVVIVGDSMGRTQWESLSCLLLEAVPRKSSVVMVEGPITRQKRYIGTRFEDHDITIDYYRSPFIVLEGHDIPKNSPTRVHSTLKLKKIDKSVAHKFVDADILLINTGHWWTRQKTYDSGCYFQLEHILMLGMPVIAAYENAVSTITTWVNDHVNFSRTEVFFRSFEPPHWELSMATQPYSNISHPQDYPRARILKEAVRKMLSPAMVLDITSLSSYRPDGHVFNWTGLDRANDCAHWCLPGVPDTWNELLYASLLMKGRGVWTAKKRTQ